jgi:hypothetical protein
MLLIIIIALIIASIIFSPLLAIWAINVLAHGAFVIDTSFKTWFAMLLLIVIFGASAKTSSSK